MVEKIESIKKWLDTSSINIFGVQFSGKDTVGKKLAADLGAKFISSGDIVRAAREDNSNQKIQKAALESDTGALTPTDEFKELICPYLYSDEVGGKPLVLSSVGRWIGEEGPIMEALARGDHDVKAVILLRISEEEALARWNAAKDSRNDGRIDDTSKERVLRRLGEFRNKTLPVIDTYRRMGILIEVNGEQSRDEVFAEVIDKLYDFSKS